MCFAQVGAIARESLPAAGVEYATEANRRELLRIYRRCGQGRVWEERVGGAGGHGKQQDMQPHSPRGCEMRVGGDVAVLLLLKLKSRSVTSHYSSPGQQLYYCLIFATLSECTPCHQLTRRTLPLRPTGTAATTAARGATPALWATTCRPTNTSKRTLRRGASRCCGCQASRRRRQRWGSQWGRLASATTRRYQCR